MGVQLKGKVLTWDNEFAQENNPFNPSLKNILEVLNRLYRAPLEPDNWTEFLKDMAELFESNGAHIGIMDLATGKILMDAVAGYDISPTDYEVYTGHVPNDPRVAQMLKQPFRPTHCREFMEDQDFRDTDVYLEVLSKVDIEYTLCVGLSSGQKYLSFFALMRGREAQPFNEAERSLLELLAPHIGNAIELDHALTESHGSAELCARRVRQDRCRLDRAG